jgi:hypothetical protein
VVKIERSLAPLAAGDLRLELGEPAICDLGEGQPRWERQLSDPIDALQRLALPALLWGCGVDGKQPDRFDWMGAAIVLIGVLVVLWGRQLFA